MKIPPVVNRILPFWIMGHAVMLFLIAMMSGVVKKNLQMFNVDLSDLSMTNSEMASLFTKRDTTVASLITAAADAYNSGSTDPDSLISAVFGDDNNITAADLGLANKYEIGLWGYCAISQNGSRSCSSAKFDWAKKAINMSLIDSLPDLTNDAIQVPKKLKDGLKTFTKVSMYTQACFVSAFLHLIAGMVMGLVNSFLKPLSRKIWIMGSMGIIMAPASGALMASILVNVTVSAVKDVSKDYGGSAKLSINFIGMVWSAIIFDIAACVIWIMRAHPADGKPRGSVDGEKLIHGASATQYQPVDHSGAMGSGATQNSQSYEPYSQRG
ncbi:hypothetical protein BROUX41_006195 [Berkeleyomyces rouxiae]|uniref:uncharacterized protein n=1 Tax=Berkeleyomyces rouxiae TaxID=2035830 RepID=UPI003B7A0E2C